MLSILKITRSQKINMWIIFVINAILYVFNYYYLSE